MRLFENSKSTITRKLLADSRTFGSLSSYSQDSMKKVVYRRWDNRLRNLNISVNFGFQAKREGILPKHLSKAHTKRMVQLLTQHSVLFNFQFHIGRCFTPVCTCMLEEESTEHFLYRCPFYSNLRSSEPPKPLVDLLDNCSWENWKTTLNFVEFSRRLQTSHGEFRNCRKLF